MKFLSIPVLLATIFLAHTAEASFRDAFRYHLIDRPSHHLSNIKNSLLYGRRRHHHHYPSGYGAMSHHHYSRRLSHGRVRWNRTDRRLKRINYSIRLFLEYKRTHPHDYHEHAMAYKALGPVLRASHQMYLAPLRHYRYYRRMNRMRNRLRSRRHHRSHHYQQLYHGGDLHGGDMYGGQMMHRPRYMRSYSRGYNSPSQSMYQHY